MGRAGQPGADADHHWWAACDREQATIATRLACEVHAAFVRVDTIEQAILGGTADPGLGTGRLRHRLCPRRDPGTPRNGLSVLAESVNPLAVTRPACAVTLPAGMTRTLWRSRSSVRTPPNTVAGQRLGPLALHRDLRLPTWQNILDRAYEAWDSPASSSTRRRPPPTMRRRHPSPGRPLIASRRSRPHAVEHARGPSRREPLCGNSGRARGWPAAPTSGRRSVARPRPPGMTREHPVRRGHPGGVWRRRLPSHTRPVGDTGCGLRRARATVRTVANAHHAG